MRLFPLAGAIALALVLGGSLYADPVPRPATISATEADVRCGPSLDARFYPTNRLHKGDIVQVLKVRPDGWLEIQPPAGSFSWINARFLMQTQPDNFVVNAPAGSKVQVLVGSELASGKPNVSGSTVEQGTLIHRYQRAGRPGAPFQDGDQTWFPIDPPAGEIRYLKSDAVALTAASAVGAGDQAPPASPRPIGGTVVSVTPVSPPATLSAGAAVTADKTPTHAEIDELYQKAVEADRAGNTPLAIQLYAKVGALGLPINHAFAPQAIARANKLLNEPAGGPTPVVDSRFRPLTGDPTPQPTVRLDRPSSVPTATDPTVTPAGAMITTSRQTSDPNAGFQWIGRLRRAGRVLEERATYVLESAKGTPIIYAGSANGLNLEAYVGQTVELIGTAGYYGQIRANYMTVTQVRPIR